MKGLIYFLPLIFALTFCSSPKPAETQTDTDAAVTDTATVIPRISDDSLLTLVEYNTFQYFWNGAEPTSGAARERYHSDNIYPENDKHIVTSGGTGFGVMAILVGIERGFITRKEGFDHLSKFVGWLEKADRFHGVWPHWWNGETGKVKPFSPKDDGGDLVETSYLAQGLLCVILAWLYLSTTRRINLRRYQRFWFMTRFGINK